MRRNRFLAYNLSTMSNLTTALNLAQLFDVDDLIISTARYYTGRTTALAGTFAMQLANAWPQLSGVVQAQIRKDLEHAFERDDWARKARAESTSEHLQHQRLPLGHDMDRQCWEAVRRAWHKAQPQEASRPQERPQLDLFDKLPTESDEPTFCGIKVRLMPFNPDDEHPPF